MFLKFYDEIDADHNMTMDIEELRELFEKFARIDGLIKGKDKVRKLIQIIGVDPESGLLSLLKEGQKED